MKAAIVLGVLGGLGIIVAAIAGKMYVTSHAEALESTKTIPLVKIQHLEDAASQLAKDYISAPLIELQPENTLNFNDVVTEESVAKFQQQLQTMSARLPKDAVIRLVLYTPGGCVPCGMQMNDAIKAIPQRVDTLTIFAASMGWQIVQNAGKRMILPSGVLMNHRASGGVEGEFGGSLDSRLAVIRREIDFLDNVAATRMGMTIDQYREQQRDEFWINGFDAVEARAADQVVYARCSEKFSGTVDKVFHTFFGPVKVTFSKCPLITGPLEIQMPAMDRSNNDPEEAYQFVRLLYVNPLSFVDKYIKTNRYRQILR